ncbi:DEAD-box type RNA helicase, partial [Nowakowskiella sp. JEL0078]
KTKTILGLIGSILVAGGTAGGNAIISPATTVIDPKRRPNAPAITSTPIIATKSQEAIHGRILVCAPSNAACDEIVRRLKKGSFDWWGGKSVDLKIVRLGSNDSIHPDVRDVSLEALLEERLLSVEYNSLIKDGTDEKVRDLRAKINALSNERERLREARSVIEGAAGGAGARDTLEKLNAVELQLKDVGDKRSELFALLQNEQMKSKDYCKKMEVARVNGKVAIMREANVLLCTLNAAGSDMLVNIEKLEFPVVIVDEACQSIELSSLIPLRYNTKKCIMVGDPNQLPPTVLSKKAQNFLYERSLFQRVMLQKPESVQLLNIQYRMHPEISRLPSLLFYDSKLENAPGLIESCRASWHDHPILSPYRLFDVDGREQQGSSHSIFNPDEIEACVNLIEMICHVCPDINFGSRIG